MTQSSRLAGKVAIVTGASRGLGQYCAMAFAQEGAKVVVVGRNARQSSIHMPGTPHLTAAAIEEHLGVRALPIIADVTDPEAVEAMAAKTLAKWGRIDIVMNNAAFVMPEGEKTSALAPRLFEQMLQVNVNGALNVIRAVLPAMKAQHCGAIINVSGRSRTRGSPLEATKAALETLTVGLAAELLPAGVAVNSLRPAGFIDTPGALLNPEVRSEECMSPQSYVEAAVLLARETADTYTGQVKTDAEIIRELGGEAAFRAFVAANPPEWALSASPAASA
ncbi:MAG: SDR family NAD(P)-dependent oxidoreductase [Hyphomonadaceae bacterium]